MGTTSFSFPPPTFPVKLVLFQGNATNDRIDLVWKTSEEENFDTFEIQKSTDAKAFETIGVLKSGKLNQYTFTDQKPRAGHNYHRLKMTDLDGSFSFSKIINTVFNLDTPAKVIAFPNPSPESQITLSKSLKKDQIMLHSITGQAIDFEIAASNTETVLSLKNAHNQKEILLTVLQNNTSQTERILIH